MASRFWLATLILALSSQALAQTVTTPLLNTVSGSTTLCRVVNRTGASIAPAVRIKSGSNGGILASNGALSIANGAVGEISVTSSAGLKYCQVEFGSNAQADKSRVDMVLKDSSGELQSAVRGVRLGNSQDFAQVYTPSLAGGSNSIYCYALNTDSSSQWVKITLRDASGASINYQLEPNLAGGTGFGLTVSAPSYCEVQAQSDAAAKLLRVSIVEEASGVGSLNALEGY